MLAKRQRQLGLGAPLILALLFSVRSGAPQRQSSAQHKPTPAMATTPEAASRDTTLIKPGQNVGLLRLGDTRERTLELFPLKPHIDEEYSYDDSCPVTEIHWLDQKLDANGVFIYLKNGRVFQIESATPRYRTAEGITTYTPPTNVRPNYPHLRTYVLLYSGADIVGGRDLIYWVDHQNGIAFEMYYDRKARRRLVYKVIVFEPGTEFQPEGCVRPPQEWHELKAFSLEPTEKVQRPR